MFRFANIEYLYALGLLPLMLLLYLLMRHWRKKALEKFGDSFIVFKMMPDVSNGKTRLKLLMQICAMAFIIMALAKPQTGAKLEEVKREGADLMICLDVSNSMLAEDLSPNRIENAKYAMLKMVDELKGDRIGIIVFAGEAYVQLPITTDYAAAKMFIHTINTHTVPVQGTAIRAAIQLALSSFPETQQEQQLKNRAIIIISDGENHEDDPLPAAEEAAKQGIVIHTIGMGSPQGAPIPIYHGKQKTGYRTDKDGNTVITKLDELTLQQIAATTNGIYVRTTNAQSGMKTVMDEIAGLDKQEISGMMYTDYEDIFQYFVAIALLLLTLDFFISRRKNRWASKIDLFGEKKKTAA